MKLYLWISCLIPLVIPTTPAVRRFDQEQLVSIPYSKENLQLSQSLNLDIWEVSREQGIVARVNPQTKRQLSHQVQTKVLLPNLQKFVDEGDKILELDDEIVTDDRWHTAYHSMQDISAWMKALAAKYPQVASFNESIGSTEEGRSIPMMTIKAPSTTNKEVKSIWLQGLQHAREWIAGATTQYLIDYFTSGYGRIPQVTALLDAGVVIKIVPICNPDGYEYSRTSDRMWRKTRASVDNAKVGIDSNRNWPDHWNRGGASSNPSDDTYMGPAPGSAKEVKALMAEYQKTTNVYAAVDFHSYSQLILRPFDWTDDLSRDEVTLANIGKKMRDIYQSSSSLDFTSERGVELYPSSGGAPDWWYGIGTNPGQHKPYALTIELPPKSFLQGGFNYAASNIKTVGKGTADAVLELINYALENPLPIYFSLSLSPSLFHS